jgi:flagellar hook-associated protein 3 FlgL
MKTTSISTHAISEATRISRVKLQIKLAEGQKEATTGRLADVGRTLGYEAGRSVSLRQEVDRLNTFQDTNSIANTRLQLTQTTLEGVSTSAQEFINTLIVARSTTAGGAVAVSDAKAQLIGLMGALNTAVNGAHIFAGINTDVKPITDYYETPAPANKVAVDTAFVSEFGLAQSDPGVELITAADMQTFLDGTFNTMFEPADWTTTWSQASDQNIKTRISSNELIDTATNANAEPFRKLAMAFTMISDLGIEDLGLDAYQTVVDKAIEVVGSAVSSLTTLRASLGTGEERIAAANERMTLQLDVLTTHINTLESVDPFEAAANVNALLTQVETAYALTARLQGLSLVNFLR